MTNRHGPKGGLLGEGRHPLRLFGFRLIADPVDDPRPRSLERRLFSPSMAMTGGLLVVALACGFQTGRVFRSDELAAAHASGACIALEMAAAHGVLDGTARRIVVRSLTSALNPHFDRFPEHAAGMRKACEQSAGGGLTASYIRPIR